MQPRDRMYFVLLSAYYFQVVFFFFFLTILIHLIKFCNLARVQRIMNQNDEFQIRLLSKQIHYRLWKIAALLQKKGGSVRDVFYVMSSLI